MRLTVDDAVHRVDSVWLGPREFTLPFRARYKSYGLGLGVLLALRIAESQVGIPITFWTVAYTLLATVAITTILGRAITYERGVAALGTALAHEITAPRPTSTMPRRVHWRTDRVSVQAAPLKTETK